MNDIEKMAKLLYRCSRVLRVTGVEFIVWII